MRCYKNADKTKKLSDGKIIAGWGIVVQRMMPSQYGAWSLSVLLLTVYCRLTAGHPTCLELTQEMIPIIKSYEWQCMECKTCVKCQNPHDEVATLCLQLFLHR